MKKGHYPFAAIVYVLIYQTTSLSGTMYNKSNMKPFLTNIV